MTTKWKITTIEPGKTQDYKKQLSGRCPVCQIRFIWDKTAKISRTLSGMRCPYCTTALWQTTHMWRGDTKEIHAR